VTLLAEVTESLAFGLEKRRRICSRDQKASDNWEQSSKFAGA
jgi:hypothetical protein